MVASHLGKGEPQVLHIEVQQIAAMIGDMLQSLAENNPNDSLPLILGRLSMHSLARVSRFLSHELESRIIEEF